MSGSARSPLGFFSGGEAAPEPTGDPAKIAEVEKVLAEIRPYLTADGGNIHLVAVEDGWVSVRLQGACCGCHASAMTLYDGLEPRLRQACRWVRGVRAV
ncbi:MAG: NifU family protein [Planctomycetota bacterium]